MVEQSTFTTSSEDLVQCRLTTYYLRTLGASQIEKATLDAKKFGFTQKREYKKVDNNQEQEVIKNIETDMTNVKACSIIEPECETCQ